jgi:hypothetical protein
MRHGVPVHRACPWWLAMAVFGWSLMWSGATAAVAQPCTTPDCADHLKCYQVIKDTHPVHRHVVDLFNQQFGAEPGCKLSDHASLFCAPTVKRTVDGNPPPHPFPTQELLSDYICYRVTCPDPKTFQFNADDQFTHHGMAIKTAKLLCAPAVKVVP